MTNCRLYNEKIPLFGMSRLRVGSDGGGIRTLIATYGCPLKCRYCLNPRSWDSDYVPSCLTMEELYERVKIDNLYFQATGGGLTFGGGEPLLHAGFISEFITKYCKDWNIAFETSLNVPEVNVRQVIELADFLYIDIKSMDSDIYRVYAGKDNINVLSNLQILINECPDKFLVRIPLISGYNSLSDCKKSEEILNKMGVKRTQIFEYKIV